MTSLQNTDTFAKAGVMLRDNTSSTAAHVILDVRPDGSLEFMTRSTSGAETTFLAGGSASYPVWLRLTRSGSTVTGEMSADGSTWTTVGTTTLSIAADAWMGMAVTSHVRGVLATATFDNVQP